MTSFLGRFAQQASEGFVDFVAPSSCQICATLLDSRSTVALCAACRAEIEADPSSQCQKCGAEVGPHLPTDDCIFCRNERFPFAVAMSVGMYNGGLRRLVLSAKQAREAQAAVLIGRLIAGRVLQRCGTDWNSFPNANPHYDLITAVPSHRRDRVSRPFHSGDAIAESTAVTIRLPYDPGIVQKTRRTPRQVTLAPTARRSNLRAVFSAAQPLTGLRILLVDDVLTTGTTAAECSRAMLAAGAASVDVAVAARSVGGSPSA